MTVWAGYYLRDPRGVARDALTDSLALVLSRRQGDKATITRFDRAAFLHIETGAFADSSAIVEPSRAFSLVAGEPILTDAPVAGRAADIARLHDAWSRQDFSIARASAGTFAGVHYDAVNKAVSLVADKVGLRPTYYAVTDEVIYFASALRILEALPALPKVMDVRGAVETLALGYPLADRTPYCGIHTMLNGEVVTFRQREIAKSRYWNLADLPERRTTIDEAAERVHALFSQAIDRRLGTDRAGVAFLSGGLDSRCLVAELAARGVQLHTFNFANQGTKDQIFGDAFAKIVGTRHSRTPRPLENIKWSSLMADVWSKSPYRTELPVERPGLMWSGDGGSVGLGFVGVYPSVIALLRAGKRDEAVEKYFQEHEISVPLRVFRGRIAEDVRDIVHNGVLEALDDVRCDEDPGRELYAFRMAHDQRRHLMFHFEDVDLHRLEFHLPFYDADLLAAVAETPPDFGVRHRLYHEALKFFPPTVMQVAWQAYPGHQPCPVPEPAEAIDQWGDAQKDIIRRARRSGILGEAARMAFSRSFPGPILDRRYLVAASIAHWVGVGDYGYVLDYAKAFSEMFGNSNGRWALSSDVAA
jgi:hypothetical protein